MIFKEVFSYIFSLSKHHKKTLKYF